MATEEGQVIGCHTLNEWTDNLDKGRDAEKLIVIDFTASWCGPCRFIAPVLADLAKRFPTVLFLKVDVDEREDVAQEFGIEAMPTFVFMKDGNIVDKVVGAKKDDLQQTVAKHVAATASA